MEKTVSIPLTEALEALWYINDCFGFRKPYAESAILLNSFSKGEYLRTPTISQDRISDLLENILNIDRNENHLVHLVLWLNANINRPGHELIESADLFQGSRNATGHRTKHQWKLKWCFAQKSFGVQSVVRYFKKSVIGQTDIIQIGGIGSCFRFEAEFQMIAFSVLYIWVVFHIHFLSENLLYKCINISASSAAYSS